ncbi:hypothetical protein [Pseudomonas sp. 2FE]|uniref:hypothetical protein n=1 Tax=Pseudomonas sp. 2FE TaxID=2502190 RepID=UPI0010F8EDDE|nr:hypothetical protein [Pseudomonas sp. 2FE]
MSDRNNPSTLAGLRDKIRTLVAATTPHDAPNDYGYINGWLGALYWADVIDRQAHDDLKAEAHAAFEHALAAAPAR